MRERLAGTALASAPIVPVSARTGDGIEALVAALDVDARRGRRARARPRPALRRPCVHDQGRGHRGHGDARGRLPGRRRRGRAPALRYPGADPRPPDPQAGRGSRVPGEPRRREPRRGGTSGARARRGARSRRHAARHRDLRRRDPAGPRPRARGDHQRGVRRARRGGRGGGDAPVPGTGRSSIPAAKPSCGYASRTPWSLDPFDRFVLRDAGRQETVGGGTVLDPFPPLRPGADAHLRLSARASASVDDLPRLLTDRARSGAGHRGAAAHGVGGSGAGPDRRLVRPRRPGRRGGALARGASRGVPCGTPAGGRTPVRRSTRRGGRRAQGGRRPTGPRTDRRAPRRPRGAGGHRAERRHRPAPRSSGHPRRTPAKTWTGSSPPWAATARPRPPR